LVSSCHQIVHKKSPWGQVLNPLISKLHIN
jgi:hypothetical protein